MKSMIFISFLFSITSFAGETTFNCVDLQSLAIEGFCYNPSPGTPDYVYPFRKCYTSVELELTDIPIPTDAGILTATTKVRHNKLIELMSQGKLHFELPEVCWPTSIDN